jgi:hypothetical protein
VVTRADVIQQRAVASAGKCDLGRQARHERRESKAVLPPRGRSHKPIRLRTLLRALQTVASVASHFRTLVDPGDGSVIDPCERRFARVQASAEPSRRESTRGHACTNSFCRAAGMVGGGSGGKAEGSMDAARHAQAQAQRP